MKRKKQTRLYVLNFILLLAVAGLFIFMPKQRMTMKDKIKLIREIVPEPLLYMEVYPDFFKNTQWALSFINRYIPDANIGIEERDGDLYTYLAETEDAFYVFYFGNDLLYMIEIIPKVKEVC